MQVEIAHRKGQQLPEGWCVDVNGEPTINPEGIAANYQFIGIDVIKRGGNLLPLGTDRERGGHKGYAL